MQDVGSASGAAEDAIWIYLCDIPAANIAANCFAEWG
jgi:hypothetical protein